MHAYNQLELDNKLVKEFIKTLKKPDEKLYSLLLSNDD